MKDGTDECSRQRSRRLQGRSFPPSPRRLSARAGPGHDAPAPIKPLLIMPKGTSKPRSRYPASASVRTISIKFTSLRLNLLVSHVHAPKTILTQAKIVRTNSHKKEFQYCMNQINPSLQILTALILSINNEAFGGLL